MAALGEEVTSAADEVGPVERRFRLRGGVPAAAVGTLVVEVLVVQAVQQPWPGAL
ncbi:hypothetical protein ACR820_01925 [Streptomyces netropsis]